MNPTGKKYPLHKSSILKSDEFAAIFANGYSLRQKYFLFLFVPAESVKIGFVVKKNRKTAVKRNKIKRIERELWRISSPLFSLSASIIVAAGESVLDCSFKPLTEDFMAGLCRIESALRESHWQQ
jgi:ribonuclease P protein component